LGKAGLFGLSPPRFPLFPSEKPAAGQAKADKRQGDERNKPRAHKATLQRDGKCPVKARAEK
jgi:hypothetical protein